MATYTGLQFFRGHGVECLLCRNSTDSSQNENHALNISKNWKSIFSLHIVKFYTIQSISFDI